MSDRLCATTSWSSRAMRSCSSLRPAVAPPPRVRAGVRPERSRRMRTISVVVASTSSQAASARPSAQRRTRRPGAEQRRQPQERHPAAGDRHPRHRAVSGEQRGAERDDEREVDRPLRVSEHDVRERGRVRDEEDGDRVAHPPRQRRRARRRGAARRRHRSRARVSWCVAGERGAARSRRPRHRTAIATVALGTSVVVMPATVGGACRGACGRTA